MHWPPHTTSNASSDNSIRRTASWRIGRMVHFCAGATTGAWGRSGAISRAEVA
jgi:hypothetical protein